MALLEAIPPGGEDRGPSPDGRRTRSDLPTRRRHSYIPWSPRPTAVTPSANEPGRPAAILGERELVIGFRLIGVRDAIVAPETGASKEFQKLFESGKYSLILVSQKVQRILPEALRRQAESSIDPLVVFLPTPGAGEEPESLAQLAKRVLGISLESESTPAVPR